MELLSGESIGRDVYGTFCLGIGGHLVTFKRQSGRIMKEGVSRGRSQMGEAAA